MPPAKLSCTCFRWRALFLIASAIPLLPARAKAQSPELAMREFSSGQIKKGVRSIGFGGDGATWGNYGLVWLDASTALVDYADTHYTNGNNFYFSAVGWTSPALWHGLTIYVIGMFQRTGDIQLRVKSAGLGPGPIPVHGRGSDNAFFSKIALPLGKGFSAGVLLSRETSEFDARTLQAPNLPVSYQSRWRPSGGFGVAWQPDKKLLFGFRGLFNNDGERRTDPTTVADGSSHTIEFRAGASFAPWKGALLDAGATRLNRGNSLAGSHTLVYHPNLGFEQSLLRKRLGLRFGLDETSPTAGFSLKAARFKLDAAYVRNMARSRVGTLFGDSSNAVLFTFTLDYRRKPQNKAKSKESQKGSTPSPSTPGFTG